MNIGLGSGREAGMAQNIFDCGRRVAHCRKFAGEGVPTAMRGQFANACLFKQGIINF